MMKMIKWLWLLLPFALPSQIEKVIVETYYIADANDLTDTDGGKLDSGSVTYRVYVDLKPGNKLRKIFGDKNHPLKVSSTKPFFNNVDGETYARNLKKGLYNSGTVPLDTWLTLGQTAGKTTDGKANFGILKPQDTNGSFVGGQNNSGGSAGIAGGLLTNSVATMGLPVTTADGMMTMALPNYTWTEFGIRDFLSGADTTIFGSLVKRSVFTSTTALLDNKPGVQGLVPDSNQVLIAQFTTAGQLKFELNIEVEQTDKDGLPQTVRYVANGDTLLEGEIASGYLTFPYVPLCGCKDYRYLEYSAKYECADPARCQTLVRYGCRDTMACNFDPLANFAMPGLCCYPGQCLGRDIAVVCPGVRGARAECSLHPNPAQEQIFLDMISGEQLPVSYALYDYSGTQVRTGDLGVQQLLVNYPIDLSGLGNGIYLCRVLTGTQESHFLFIKN